MFIPIIDWNDVEEMDEMDEPTINDSSCGCCKIDPTTNQKGVCICTDCKCHIKRRNRIQMIWTDPIVLYGVISAAMMAILFLAIK
jgi:uncharacterized paraquat-inducible protein A